MKGVKSDLSAPICTKGDTTLFDMMSIEGSLCVTGTCLHPWDFFLSKHRTYITVFWVSAAWGAMDLLIY